MQQGKTERERWAVTEGKGFQFQIGTDESEEGFFRMLWEPWAFKILILTLLYLVFQDNLTVANPKLKVQICSSAGAYLDLNFQVRSLLEESSCF